MKSNFFKAVNMVAAKLEGHRDARLRGAYAIVKNGRVDQVCKLFNEVELETLTNTIIAAGVKDIKTAKNEAIASIEDKQENEQEFAAAIEYLGVPSNVVNQFGEDVACTVHELIQRFVKNVNKDGKTKYEHKFAFDDGMEALENVGTLLELQAVVMTYFMKPYIQNQAYKFITMGIGFKLRKKRDMTQEEIEQRDFDIAARYAGSWAEQPSSSGAITQYDMDDITQEVIKLSYEKLFSESIFDQVANVYYSLFFRISNAVQKMMNQLRRETKVRTNNSIYIQTTRNTSSEYSPAFIVEQYGFTGEEAKVLELFVQNYRKKEIDEIMGKRTDRVFKRIAKTFATA